MKWLVRLNEEEHSISGKDYLLYGMLLFIAGGILGFIIEELYFLLEDGILVKRGFLYGPFIPIYGWGILIIAFLVIRFKKHPLLIFVLSMLFSGILEGLTGYFMLQIWGKRWWDYTGLTFSIGGFVCLKSFLQFGVGGLAVTYFLDPLVKKIICTWNRSKLYVFAYSVMFLYLIDNLFSFLVKHRI